MARTRVSSQLAALAALVALFSHAAGVNFSGSFATITNSNRNARIDGKSGSAAFIVSTSSNFVACPDSFATYYASVGSLGTPQAVGPVCTSSFQTNWNISAAISVGKEILVFASDDIFFFNITSAGVFPDASSSSRLPVTRAESNIYGFGASGGLLQGQPHYIVTVSDTIAIASKQYLLTGSGTVKQLNSDVYLEDSAFEPTGRFAAVLTMPYSAVDRVDVCLYDASLNTLTNTTVSAPGTIPGLGRSRIAVSSGGLVAVADWENSKISFVGISGEISLGNLVNPGIYSNMSGAIALNQNGDLLAVSINGQSSSLCPNVNGLNMCTLLYFYSGSSWSLISRVNVSGEFMIAQNLAWGNDNTLFAFDNSTNKFWRISVSTESVVAGPLPQPNIALSPVGYNLRFQIAPLENAGIFSADGFEVEYRMENTNEWTQLVKWNYNQPSPFDGQLGYTIACVQPGRTYFARARFVDASRSRVGNWSIEVSASTPSLASLGGGLIGSLQRCGGSCSAPGSTSTGGCTISSSCTTVFTNRPMTFPASFELTSGNSASCTLSGGQVCCSYSRTTNSGSSSTSSCGNLVTDVTVTMNYEETSSTEIIDYETFYSISRKSSYTATFTGRQLSATEIFRLSCPDTQLDSAPSTKASPPSATTGGATINPSGQTVTGDASVATHSTFIVFSCLLALVL